MSSGAWGSGQTPGDGSTSGRGTAGEAASSWTGSARPLIAWASLLLTVLCVVVAFVTGRANGVLLLGTGSLGVAIWAMGAWRWSFWCANESSSRRLDAVDDEIEFVDSVLRDIKGLDGR